MRELQISQFASRWRIAKARVKARDEDRIGEALKVRTRSFPVLQWPTNGTRFGMRLLRGLEPPSRLEQLCPHGEKAQSSAKQTLSRTLSHLRPCLTEAHRALKAHVRIQINNNS